MASKNRPCGGRRFAVSDCRTLVVSPKDTLPSGWRKCAIARKYPRKAALDLLADLVASSPGNEGKWFAAAKSAGLYSEAIELANRTPCDPKTLTRAARDMKNREPGFAVEAGITALRWLVDGYGYEITSLDVREAYQFTMEAARNAGCENEARERIIMLVESDTSGNSFASRIIGRELEI